MASIIIKRMRARTSFFRIFSKEMALGFSQFFYKKTVVAAFSVSG
jgi:hypothetical protein